MCVRVCVFSACSSARQVVVTQGKLSVTRLSCCCHGDGCLANSERPESPQTNKPSLSFSLSITHTHIFTYSFTNMIHCIPINSHTHLHLRPHSACEIKRKGSHIYTAGLSAFPMSNVNIYDLECILNNTEKITHTMAGSRHMYTLNTCTCKKRRILRLHGTAVCECTTSTSPYSQLTISRCHVKNIIDGIICRS